MKYFQQSRGNRFFFLELASTHQGNRKEGRQFVYPQVRIPIPGCSALWYGCESGQVDAFASPPVRDICLTASRPTPLVSDAR